jgi:hypothetical protein
VEVADRRVQAVGDGSDVRLAFEHRVGISKHRVPRVGGVRRPGLRAYSDSA